MTNRGDKKSYEIRTVEDFFKVPAESRPLCLQEFAQFVTLMGTLGALLNPSTVKPDLTRFVWIDDNKGKAHLRWKLPDGSVLKGPTLDMSDK